ncbi:MAG: 4Fe-4S dicluster domain-containing protein [Acidobacteria bacterium]|nr:4Fe-4S dicluster domain-containing protein [Acidobacteriota bacterium]
MPHDDSGNSLPFWRSLDELARLRALRFRLRPMGFGGQAGGQAGAEDEHLAREFSDEASELTDPVDRRQFLKLMGASLALAGSGACTRQPLETIVPYVRSPEQVVPGQPLFFATAMPFGGGSTGLLVESHMGRPTKVEGNPDHPASLGATDPFAQASVLDLYDPDRAQTLTYLGDIRPWASFLGAARVAIDGRRAAGGRGFRVLTETVTSPTLGFQLSELLKAFPEARWHQYEPISNDNARRGAQMAVGEVVAAQCRLDRADVIVSLDADFLTCGGASVRYAHDFAAKRRLRKDQPAGMSRLYVVESSVTNTGAVADARIAVKPSEVLRIAWALGARLPPSRAERASASLAEAYRGGGKPGITRPGWNAGSERVRQWIEHAARDLEAHRGRSLVMAGEWQPPEVHAIAHAVNAALDNVGQTVVYTEPTDVNPVDQTESLRELVGEMSGGGVDLLLILGGNPVYTAPADLEFANALQRVPLRIHLSPDDNETSALCQWHVPEAHFLEAWGDTRAFDGTVSIVQPLIAPLYDAHTAHEVLAAFSDRPVRSSYDIVREYWRSWFDLTVASAFRRKDLPAEAGSHEEAFERFWRLALHDGVVANTAFPAKNVRAATMPPAEEDRARGEGLEIAFRPDPTIYDGRFANNAWLQELPKPITKLTWDNAVLVSPATADRHGWQPGDLVELGAGGRNVHAPIWIVPGHPDDTITVNLGYGRERVGRVGSGAGFNVYKLRTSEAMWIATGVSITGTGTRQSLACTQEHHAMQGRELVRAATLEQYRADPDFAHHREHSPPRDLTLYPNYEYPGYAWGMAIDLNVCTGCNACIVACQAENNIPVVGREQVARGREMHWLRVDRYYKGDASAPDTYFQPVPCMHCETAPCELVCPVAATSHSDEGLNDMVYNRCIGTRYCSNNCPYKVRRFNFLQFADWKTPSLKMQRNPDVSVRSRGVMEKCTYCVQRINAARIEAEKEDREIRDGEVVTACQAACPTNAIVFGNINDPNSRVAQLKAEPRNYGLLASLNTRPRTTYLAAVRNPGDLPPNGGSHEDGGSRERRRSARLQPGPPEGGHYDGDDEEPGKRKGHE